MSEIHNFTSSPATSAMFHDVFPVKICDPFLPTWHPWHRRTPRHRRGDEALRGAVLALGVDVHVAAELRGGDLRDLAEAEFSVGKMEDVGGFSRIF